MFIVILILLDCLFTSMELSLEQSIQLPHHQKYEHHFVVEFTGNSNDTVKLITGASSKNSTAAKHSSSFLSETRPSKHGAHGGGEEESRKGPNRLLEKFGTAFAQTGGEEEEHGKNLGVNVLLGKRPTFLQMDSHAVEDSQRPVVANTFSPSAIVLGDAEWRERVGSSFLTNNHAEEVFGKKNETAHHASGESTKAKTEGAKDHEAGATGHEAGATGHEGAKGHEAGGHEAGGHEAGGHEAGGHGTTGHGTTGHGTTGHGAGAKGHEAGGHGTTGHGTTGHGAGGHGAGGHGAGGHALAAGHEAGGGHHGGGHHGPKITISKPFTALSIELLCHWAGLSILVIFCIELVFKHVYYWFVWYWWFPPAEWEEEDEEIGEECKAGSGEEKSAIHAELESYEKKFPAGAYPPHTRVYISYMIPSARKTAGLRSPIPSYHTPIPSGIVSPRMYTITS